ncbi:hypothetical protein [Flavobacterium sp. AG291]|uniref:hypothetical protein n=1 Tax=Flavobacterium sp. AG291 TaxID=2184000 RepID=UPI000E0AB926|nr:hypothetical protein [Flavobacterium sp. AG291]RDI05497.1 hypothetical protein DEU42_11760 [Flavobacterium sp. AG291]
MRNYYFIVLQLPESCKSGFEDVLKETENFLAKAAQSVAEKEAKLLSMRCGDTGSCEDLRNHLETTTDFNTYLLLEIPLEEYEVHEAIIFQKAAELLYTGSEAELIDKDERFELITAA